MVALCCWAATTREFGSGAQKPTESRAVPIVENAIITGATGMIGGACLRLCLDSPEISRVTAVGRRATGLSHDKLAEIVRGDFLDLSGVDLTGQDVCLFCLGVYSGAVPDDEFRKITTDYTVSFAEALHAASPGCAFVFLSGAGADQTERSRMAFARYKGAAEKALLAQGFPRVHIFRPGYIYPVDKRVEPNFSYRLFRALWPAIRLVWPNAGVASDVLARAMVHAGLHGVDQQVLENRDIRALANTV